MNLKEYKTKIENQFARLNILTAQEEKQQTEKDFLNQSLKSIELAQAFFQQVAKDTQEKLKFHIEDVVQIALDTIFPGEHTFKAIFEIKRGKTEVRLVLVDEYGNETDPIDNNGGGVVDVISFALRVGLLSIGKTDKVVILDEPGKFISEDLKPLFYEVVKTLSEKLRIQFLVVTHDENMMSISDRIFKVTKKNEVSKVVIQ